jgi:hypothetical protein
MSDLKIQLAKHISRAYVLWAEGESEFYDHCLAFFNELDSHALNMFEDAVHIYSESLSKNLSMNIRNVLI